MSFDPNIFDIISDLHCVATYFDMHGHNDYYIQFIPIFKLIGVGSFETALFKISMFNKELMLLNASPYLISYRMAVNKLRDIVQK